MTEISKSDYKDTSVAKKFIKNYDIGSILLSLGIFILILSPIPLLLIKAESLENKYIPTIIIASIGLLIAILSKLRMNSLKEANRNKYTVAAYDYVNKKIKDSKKLFMRDILIGILLIILSIALYFLVINNNAISNVDYRNYFTSFLIFLFAIGIFIIIRSKTKRDAYAFIKQRSC